MRDSHATAAVKQKAFEDGEVGLEFGQSVCRLRELGDGDTYLTVGLAPFLEDRIVSAIFQGLISATHPCQR